MVPAAPWCPHTRYKSCVDLAGNLALAHTHSAALEQPALIPVKDQHNERCLLTVLPVWPVCSLDADFTANVIAKLLLDAYLHAAHSGRACSIASA